MSVTIYTDGSCRPTNPGPAGFGVIIIRDQNIEVMHSQFIGKATNNVAELSAINAALDFLIKDEDYWIDGDIITDSKYCIGVLIEGWKAKKNPDLIKKIRLKLEKFPNIGIKWVKGHSGNEYNEMVDKLASQTVELNSRA